jgi:signal transduction histidine kinase
MVRPDGQIRWIFARGLALRDRAGRAYRMAGSVSDVTERKETEQQLVQAQKMEVVGQLTGGLAHDFNNILGVVLGNLDMVRDAITDDDRQAAHIDSAIGAAERGATLTKRLLAFSRKQTLAPEPVDVGKVVVEMLDLLRRTLGEPIAIEIESQDGLWLSRTDRAQLESAILNLAINSRDAMPDGGILRIETVNRCIDQAAAPAQAISAGDYVRLVIADSGAGMTPETLERVFEPFFTTKGIGKGTGLGLAMVHGFVQQSDGHIAVSSVPGRGTTVEILLPRCESVVPRPGDARSADCQVDRRGAEATLVVEDGKPS